MHHGCLLHWIRSIVVVGSESEEILMGAMFWNQTQPSSHKAKSKEEKKRKRKLKKETWNIKGS